MTTTPYVATLIEVQSTQAVRSEAGSPLRRWWTGENDLEFDGNTWEGTYDSDQGSLIRIDPVQESESNPDIRLKFTLSVTEDTVRDMLVRDIGSPLVKLYWIRSRDGQSNWIKVPRSYTGRISRTSFRNGLLVVEVETLLGDVDRGIIRYMSDESHRQQYPRDTALRHLRNLRQIGADDPWPFV